MSAEQIEARGRELLKRTIPMVELWTNLAAAQCTMIRNSGGYEGVPAKHEHEGRTLLDAILAYLAEGERERVEGQAGTTGGTSSEPEPDRPGASPALSAEGEARRLLERWLASDDMWPSRYAALRRDTCDWLSRPAKEER